MFVLVLKPFTLLVEPSDVKDADPSEDAHDPIDHHEDGVDDPFAGPEVLNDHNRH